MSAPVDLDALEALPCTCGSGGHPRACAKHPELHRLHVADLNAYAYVDGSTDAAAAWRELDEATTNAIRVRDARIYALVRELREARKQLAEAAVALDAANESTMTLLATRSELSKQNAELDADNKRMAEALRTRDLGEDLAAATLAEDSMHKEKP